MRFKQLVEAVTSQDVYDALVKSLGRTVIKNKRNIISRSDMQGAKKLIPGLRVLPKEFRDAESHGYYRLDNISGLDLAAPRVPVNPYESPTGQYSGEDYEKFLATKDSIIAGTYKGPAAPPATTNTQVAPPPKSMVAAPTITPKKPMFVTFEMVVDSVFYDARKYFSGRGVDLRKEDDGFQVRYWGDWVMPEGEEDDGDYDWEVLSHKSSKDLGKIVDEMNRNIAQGWMLRAQVGEKNWITFTVEKKKK